MKKLIVVMWESTSLDVNRKDAVGKAPLQAVFRGAIMVLANLLRALDFRPPPRNPFRRLKYLL